MSKNKIGKALAELEAGRELVGRLEKIADRIDLMFGELPLLELLEEEIQKETIYAENDHVCLTGTNISFKWSFADIVKEWIVIEADYDQDGLKSLKQMGAQFRKLAEMFEEQVKDEKNGMD